MNDLLIDQEYYVIVENFYVIYQDIVDKRRKINEISYQDAF